MADQHPITSPPELVRQWCLESEEEQQPTVVYSMMGQLATQAARWGADQELEACCEWLVDHLGMSKTTASLRAARRPKPPSLKEQALAAVAELEGFKGVDTIRRALNELPDN